MSANEPEDNGSESNEKNVDFTFGQARYGEARFGATYDAASGREDTDGDAIFGQARFGSTRFGDFGGGSGYADPWANDNSWANRAVSFWRNRGVILHRGTNLWMLLRSMFAELDRIVESANAMQRQFWIDSAQGNSLDMMGLLMGVRRRTDEADNVYRERIRAELAASTSTTTHDAVVQIMSRILRCEPKQIRIERIAEGTIDLHVEQSVLDRSPLTGEEVEVLANKMVPAGHRVGIGDSDAFLLKHENDEDDPRHGLTGPTTNEGGYLS